MKCSYNTIRKVERNGTYDTSKYRYIIGKFDRIERFELSKLDTRAALGPWEVVAEWSNEEQKYIIYK